MIKFSKIFQEISLTRIIGAIFLIIALLCGLLGYINQHSKIYIPEPIIADFYANVSAELASIAVTVLIIDYLNERRATQQEKERLILQMGSPINSATRESIRILRAKGWLTNGSLKKADLSWANLQDAYLSRVKMSGANLHRANLKGAHLQKSDLEGVTVTDFQLAEARFLSTAIMPDGSRYDGRFNLPGDLAWVRHELNINSDD